MKKCFDDFIEETKDKIWESMDQRAKAIAKDCEIADEFRKTIKDEDDLQDWFEQNEYEISTNYKHLPLSLKNAILNFALDVIKKSLDDYITDYYNTAEEFQNTIDGALEHPEETGKVCIDDLTGDDISKLQKTLEEKHGIETEIINQDHTYLKKI